VQYANDEFKQGSIGLLFESAECYIYYYQKYKKMKKKRKQMKGNENLWWREKAKQAQVKTWLILKYRYVTIKKKEN